MEFSVGSSEVILSQIDGGFGGDGAEFSFPYIAHDVSERGATATGECGADSYGKISGASASRANDGVAEEIFLRSVGLAVIGGDVLDAAIGAGGAGGVIRCAANAGGASFGGAGGIAVMGVVVDAGDGAWVGLFAGSGAGGVAADVDLVDGVAGPVGVS